MSHGFAQLRVAFLHYTCAARIRFRPSRRPSLLAQQLQLPPAYRLPETARAGHWQLYRLSGCPGQPSTDGGPPTRSFEQASRQTSASRRPSIIKPLLRPRQRPRQTFDRRRLPSRISSPLLPRRSSYSCTSSVGTPYRKIEDDTSLLEKDLLDLVDLRTSLSAQPNIARDSKILVGGSTQRVLGDGNAVMSH
jgi:hypothetical protein